MHCLKKIKICEVSPRKNIKKFIVNNKNNKENNLFPLGNIKNITTTDVYNYLIQQDKETKLLEVNDTDNMRTVSLSSSKFLTLYCNEELSSNIHYIVNGACKITGQEYHTLPEHITFNGNLSIYDCPELRVLPKTFNINGELKISHCDNLLTLSDDIKVTKNVQISNCKQLKKLGKLKNIKDGSLVLSKCSELGSLPRKIKISNDLKIMNCPKLKKFPSAISVGGDILIFSCDNFKQVPEGFVAQKDLQIDNCRIKSFPDNLQVGGDFIINNCRKLESFGDGHKIRGILSLCNNIKLRNLGEDIQVEGEIKIDQCVNLVSIPQWAFASNHKSNDTEGESSDMEYEINDTESEDINSEYEVCNEDSTLFDLTAIDPCLSNYTKESMPFFLEKAQLTVDYRNPSTRKLMEERISDMMYLIEEESDEIREAVLGIVGSVASHNGDTNLVLLALNDIDMIEETNTAKLSAFKTRDGRVLREIVRKKLCIKEINKIAHEYVETNPKADSVEITLAIQLMLGKKFDLPGRTKKMKPLCFSRLQPRDYDKAEARIRSACTDKAVEDYLQEWPEWEQFIRYCKVPLFEDLGVEYVKEIRPCALLLTPCDDTVNCTNGHVSYEALLKHYSVMGNNPFRSNEDIDWSSVKRLCFETKPKKERKHKQKKEE